MIGTLNGLVDLVERTVGDEIDVEAFARERGTTEYHLRRMFSSLAGMPLSEYVRRRRMTLAAADLAAGAPNLLDVAVRHGYGSVEAFGRAFRAVHGTGPADVRRDGGPLRTQPVLRFRLSVEGSTPMDVTITDRPELTLIGHAAQVPLIHAGVNPHIQAHVASIAPAEHGRLKAMSGTEPAGILAVTADVGPDAPEGSLLTYLHGVATDGSTPVPDDLDVVRVDAGAWAVFASRRPVPRDAPADVGGDSDRVVPLEPVAPAPRAVDPALPRAHRDPCDVRAVVAGGAGLTGASPRTDTGLARW